MFDENDFPKKQENNDRDDHGKDRDNDRDKPPGQIIHPRPTHGEPAVRGRLVRNVDSMFKAFPKFTYSEGLSQSGISGVWKGKVQPIKHSDEVRLLLDDLSHDRPLYRVEDELIHLPQCPEQHCEHPWMDADLELNREFELSITYLGKEALPRCYVVSPLIPKEKRMHMWADGAVCAFLASEGIWDWRIHTVADFLPHVLVWALKWLVYDKTGVWIGAQHNSSPQYHLQIVSGNDSCWCGSGRPYRKCCRPKDQVDSGLMPNKRFLRTGAIQVQRWWRH
jgi:hypothetical protein